MINLMRSPELPADGDQPIAQEISPLRTEIDPPIAAGPGAAPLSRALLSTAALDIVGGTARELSAGIATSAPAAPVSITGAPASRTLPPRSHESRSLNTPLVGSGISAVGADHRSGVVGTSVSVLQHPPAHPSAHAVKRSPRRAHADSRPMSPHAPIPIPASTRHAGSPEPVERTAPADHWAHPTSDLADLVAQVRAQLGKARQTS